MLFVNQPIEREPSRRCRSELAEDETSMTAANVAAVRRALETAGVEFIDENGGGPRIAADPYCKSSRMTDDNGCQLIPSAVCLASAVCSDFL
jgi:hypothetical protein